MTRKMSIYQRISSLYLFLHIYREKLISQVVKFDNGPSLLLLSFVSILTQNEEKQTRVKNKNCLLFFPI